MISRGLPSARRADDASPEARVGALSIEGKPAKSGYAVTDLLHGDTQEAFKAVGELFDLRLREGITRHGLSDQTLRIAHSFDVPFW